MNLNMIPSKKVTEDFLLPITRNSEPLIRQSQRKAEETFEIIITKPKETLPFKQPISIEGPWMVGLISLEVYFSFCSHNRKKKTNSNVTEIILTIFHLHYLKNAVEEIVGCSDLSSETLKDDTMGPLIFSVYRKVQLDEIEHSRSYFIPNGLCCISISWFWKLS